MKYLNDILMAIPIVFFLIHVVPIAKLWATDGIIATTKSLYALESFEDIEKQIAMGIKKQVAGCFKVDKLWNIYCFNFDNHPATDSDGNSKFYSVPKIDLAIGKLNKLLVDN